jgi:hypothetical protein
MKWQRLVSSPAGRLAVSLCPKDAFRPMTRLKQAYPDIRSEWPACGVMRELVLDNGPEFHSDSQEQVFVGKLTAWATWGERSCLWVGCCWCSG